MITWWTVSAMFYRYGELWFNYRRFNITCRLHLWLWFQLHWFQRDWCCGAVWSQQRAGADHYCCPDHGLPHRLLLRCNWKRAGHCHLRTIPPSTSTLHDRRLPVLPGSVRHAASADSSVTDGRDIDRQLGVRRGAVQAKPRYVRHQHLWRPAVVGLH